MAKGAAKAVLKRKGAKFGQLTTAGFGARGLYQYLSNQTPVAARYRPEFHSPWSGQPHLTHLTLNHLTEAEC